MTTERQKKISAHSLRRYHNLTPEQKAVLRDKERKRYHDPVVNARIRAARKTRRDNNRDEWNTKARQYMRDNRDKYYEYNAANRFGVKRAEIQAIRATSQVCEICGEPPAPKKRLAIDHNHRTGKLRGILCHTCNLGLGAFKDDVLRIHKAAMYLAARECKGEVG